jgi:hypothetical protein
MSFPAALIKGACSHSRGAGRADRPRGKFPENSEFAGPFFKFLSIFNGPPRGVGRELPSSSNDLRADSLMFSEQGILRAEQGKNLPEQGIGRGAQMGARPAAAREGDRESIVSLPLLTP